MRAQLGVSMANRGITQTMRDMSTGRRINSAADDAAGLAISSRMTSQIQGLEKALRNIGDACSMLQTAEGATLEIASMLQRMRELAVQSLNDVLTEADRQSVDQEYQQLKQEIDHIASSTQWNGGMALLNMQQQVHDSAVPAQRIGQGELDTATLPSGNYDLFVNGVKVTVPFVKDELPDARLGKIINAIQSSRDLHGAVADLSGDGSVALSTPDGRDLSVWYDSSISGLSASSFGLGRYGETPQVTDISITSPYTEELVEDRQDGYIQYSSTGSSALSLPAASQPDLTAGSLSVVGSTVYRGLGGSAQAFGMIDSVRNGQAGQPLRINYLSPFVNGDFESGVVGSTTVPGWTLYPERIKLDGSQSIAGYPTPVDNRSESGSYTDVTNSYTAELSNTSVAPGSTKSMMLKSTALVVDRFGVSHGPYIVSDDLYIPGGESVSFKWRATGDTDTFDVYAYLVNTDTGATTELLNRTGTSLADATSWVSASMQIPTEGNYKFVFVSGSYDFSGGRATGATMFLDDVLVSGSPPAQKPSGSELDRLAQLVQVQTGGAAVQASFELLGQTVSSGASSTASQALSQLKSQIDTLQSQGQLLGVSASLVNGKLRLSSTSGSNPFSVTQLTVGAAGYSASQVTLQAAVAGVDHATGIAAANAQSSGAAVAKGEPADDELLQKAGLLRYQIGANAGETIEYRFEDFTGERGMLDALTWDTSDKRLSRASAIAVALGEPIHNDEGQPRSHLADRHAAGQALVLLDTMLQNVDSRRSLLGSAMNRLLAAGNNVSVGVVQQSNSRGQMGDTDYAKAASELAKNQIILNSASAVLAQANASDKDILKLLGL